MISEKLLKWYDENKRSFNFRGTHDPYRIWISEIMLQQTRTETVEDYYRRFLQKFPDVNTLARAETEEVMKAWEGLGYYTRARNLHKAAKMIADTLGGVFPNTMEEVRKLPGIGAYTAAAILSIAFDQPYPSMDGNLIRVFSRLYDVREYTDKEETLGHLNNIAKAQMPKQRCGDFNQALMDIGATICTPGTPDCALCPLCEFCMAQKAGSAEELPRKANAKAPVGEYYRLYLLIHNGKAVMQKRDKNLLKDMWIYPLVADDPDEAETFLKKCGLSDVQVTEAGEYKHVFTHKIWNIRVFAARLMKAPLLQKEMNSFTLTEMEALPIPTAMRYAKRVCEEMLKEENKK